MTRSLYGGKRDMSKRWVILSLSLLWLWSCAKNITDGPDKLERMQAPEALQSHFDGEFLTISWQTHKGHRYELQRLVEDTLFEVPPTPEQLPLSTEWGEASILCEASPCRDPFTPAFDATKSHWYRMRTVSESTGEKTHWSPLLLLPNVPSKPSLPTLKAMQGGLEVSWTAPGFNNGANVTSYDLRYKKDGHYKDPIEVNSQAMQDEAVDTTPQTYSILRGGDFAASNAHKTLFYVQVRACNAIATQSCSEWSEEGHGSPGPIEAPDAPANIVVTNSSANLGQLAVSWESPSNDGGGEITHYELEFVKASETVQVNPQLEWAYMPSTNENTTCNEEVTHNKMAINHNCLHVDDLARGQKHWYRVRAYNRKGAGAWGYMADVEGKWAYQAPPAPTNVRLAESTQVGRTSTHMTVSWTLSNTEEAWVENITDQEVQYTKTTDMTAPNANATWYMYSNNVNGECDSNQVEGSTSSCELDKALLTEGVGPYLWVRVRATNISNARIDNDWSPWANGVRN